MVRTPGKTTVTMLTAAPPVLAADLGLTGTQNKAGTQVALPNRDARALVQAGVARFGLIAQASQTGSRTSGKTTVTLLADVPARLADSLGLASTDRQAGKVLALLYRDALALVEAGVARFGSAALDAAKTPTAGQKKASLGSIGPSLSLLGTRPAAQKMLTTFAAGHGYTANAGGTANLNDTTDFALGSQAVVVTTDGLGTAKTVKKVAQVAVDATGRHAKVWVKVDAQAHVSALQLYLGDTNLANNWKWEMKNSASQPWMFDGEWTVWTLPFGQATVTGTPARTAITDVQLRVVDDAAGPVTAHFGGVALVNGSTAFPSGVVSFTFDDAYLTTYTVARAKLDQYGFPGTAYVIQDYIGKAGRMTMGQLHALERLSGWEVAGHATTGTIHNNRITTLTDAQVQAEFAGIRDWLRANGFAGDHYAYPGGEYLAGQAALCEQYFTSARTVYQRQETHPPARASKLRTKGYVTSTSTVASLTAAVDEAVASGEWLIITNHDLVAAIGGTTDQLIADFQAVVDYVATKGVPVRTVGEVLRTRA